MATQCAPCDSTSCPDGYWNRDTWGCVTTCHVNIIAEYVLASVALAVSVLCCLFCIYKLWTTRSCQQKKSTIVFAWTVYVPLFLSMGSLIVMFSLELASAFTITYATSMIQRALYGLHQVFWWITATEFILYYMDAMLRLRAALHLGHNKFQVRSSMVLCRIFNLSTIIGNSVAFFAPFGFFCEIALVYWFNMLYFIEKTVFIILLVVVNTIIFSRFKNFLLGTGSEMDSMATKGTTSRSKHHIKVVTENMDQWKKSSIVQAIIGAAVWIVVAAVPIVQQNMYIVIPVMSIIAANVGVNTHKLVAKSAAKQQDSQAKGSNVSETADETLGG
eukprot:NODE_694_length_1256_cov_33.769708_g655_i0.p1 GENE.NODE_694_length_1256_cov_33.769708_g655_i0~~NODE_694_length_1256_cov_33.769708_g655_i0.p1  ORF type:complete len:365 (-),score=54.85 NODE_694_length_1256_cov_33.769708_g655_i0:160-1152(-)